jgi:hypothetical protein
VEGPDGDDDFDIRVNFTIDVTALILVGGTVYVSGAFTAIDGQRRDGLAGMDAVSGRLLAWSPQPRSVRGRGGARALAAVDGKLYVGGAFTRIGSVVREGLAAFDAATGALTAWNPAVSFDTIVGVRTLVIDRGTLYVGGDFDKVNGQRRWGLAAFNLATGTLTAWTPRAVQYVDIDAWALAIAGDTVYIGGQFDAMENERRLSLAAVDARSGRLLPWRADLERADDDQGIATSLAVVGDRLYVGGAFDSIGGRSRTNLAAFNTTTGALSPWNPRPSSEVLSLAAAGNDVLAGGAFKGVDSERRHTLAAIDLDTGALQPFDAQPRVTSTSTPPAQTPLPRTATAFS